MHEAMDDINDDALLTFIHRVQTSYMVKKGAKAPDCGTVGTLELHWSYSILHNRNCVSGSSHRLQLREVRWGTSLLS